jgi:hypothetical protein
MTEVTVGDGMTRSWAVLIVGVVFAGGWIAIGALRRYIDAVVGRFATRGEK